MKLYLVNKISRKAAKNIIMTCYLQIFAPLHETKTMKQLLSIFFLFAFSFTVSAQDLLQGNIIKKPNPQILVTDYAHVLSPEQVGILEEELVALDDSTSNQIAIVTVPTLNNRAIEDVSVATFRDWGIGNKTSRNGVLILVDAGEGEHHMRIEVGYGLEGAIPDVTANDIIDNDLVPNFKENNYFQGFQLAIQSLGKAAAGEYHVRRQANDSSGGGGSIIGIIIIVFIIIMIVGSSGGRGGGGMMSRRGSGWLAPFILGNLLGGGGSGWGGGGGGGGWSGGGGGFGGFGGGSSGGGGASGSW